MPWLLHSGSFANYLTLPPYPRPLCHSVDHLSFFKLSLFVHFKFFDQFAVGLTVGTTATIIMAFCSYKIIEKPFIKLRVEKKIQGAL